MQPQRNAIPWKPEEYDWLRSFLAAEKIQEMMGEDWESDFFVERIEFTYTKDVHFMIYEPLGRV